MIICPKCGWCLPSCWRAHRYFLYALYCRLDEFVLFYPAELVKRLKEKRDVEFGLYTFHLTKPRKPNVPYVLMILTEFKAFMYDRKLIERHKARHPSDQVGLEDFLELKKNE